MIGQTEPVDIRHTNYYNADINPLNGSSFVGGAAQDNAFTIQPTSAVAQEVGPTADGICMGIISGTDLNNYSAIIGWQEGGLGRLTNGTNTEIKPTGTTQGFHTVMLLDQDNTNLLYYPANPKKLYRTRAATTIADGTISADPTTNWQEMTGVAATLSDAITVMRVSRNASFSNATYAASNANRRMYIGTKDGKIYRLNDPAFCAVGDVPVDITPAGSSGYVSDIAVNPYNDKEILVTYSSYGQKSVWRTADATTVGAPTWEDVEGAAGSAVELASARSAMIVRAGSTTLYMVGTSTGLYGTTTLSGATTVWERIGTSANIGLAVCTSMRLRTSDNKMALGTHGNGLFMLEFPAAVLPIELLSFTGKPAHQTSVLNWETLTEINNTGFEIERKLGESWEKIGFVPSKGKNGVYTFTDDKPFNISYYRLKQVDFDGKFEYSPIVSVQFDKKGNVRIYPTVVQDQLTIEGAQSVEIVNVAGQVVYQQTKLQDTQISTATLQQGVYIVRGVDVLGVPFSEKIVKN